ncbi:MAG: CARDB domain-containing protein [Dehalococcoidia bacterium]
MAVLLTTAVACGEGEEEATPTPAPTAVPTPTPVPTLPDLTVTSITFDPAIGCEGAPVQVAVTIQNQGTLLSNACYWSWQLFTGSVTLVNTLPSLPPGGTIVVHTELALADDITGTFNTTAIVDSMSGIAEINESDNDFIQPLTVSLCDFEASYNADKSSIQTAVDAYMTSHNGSMPLTSNSVQLNYPSGTYAIIDICALIGDGELLDAVPASCMDGSFDNCAASTCACKQNARYIWLVNGAGSVLSTCIGGDCDTNFADGYQGVWP